MMRGQPGRGVEGSRRVHPLPISRSAWHIWTDIMLQASKLPNGEVRSALGRAAPHIAERLRSRVGVRLPVCCTTHATTHLTALFY